jgi:hypothetical protein
MERMKYMKVIAVIPQKCQQAMATVMVLRKKSEK